jgi:hypothetical protein
MWCGRFTVERVVPLSDMDDMDTEARPHPYIEEFEKMRNCSSTTMPIDFNHILNHHDTLQMAISEQYLRYIYALSSLFKSIVGFTEFCFVQ